MFATISFQLSASNIQEREIEEMGTTLSVGDFRYDITRS